MVGTTGHSYKLPIYPFRLSEERASFNKQRGYLDKPLNKINFLVKHCMKLNRRTAFSIFTLKRRLDHDNKKHFRQFAKIEME